MSLPKFLCIGAQKAGTTWLYWQLREHPDIWMPPLKEIHFFDHMFVPEVRSWSLWHLKSGVTPIMKWHLNNIKNPNFSYLHYLTSIVEESPFTEEWYKKIFSFHAAKGKVTGDITPEYCTVGADGIDYIKSLLINPKIIYIVRDPVSRALSQLKMNLSRHPIDDIKGEWLKSADDPVIYQRGDYASYIPEWKKRFKPSDILFIPYKMLRSDPISVLREVESHIGVTESKYKEPSKEIHVTKSIDVPKFIVDRLEEKMQNQRNFIEKEFGRKFSSLT